MEMWITEKLAVLYLKTCELQLKKISSNIPDFLQVNSTYNWKSSARSIFNYALSS